ncbi:Sjogren's syndrome/scleroderma autoantigen 1 family protein [Candidatus Harpocratesius sp.]
MSEKSVKKMANLLRNGATMLDKYCPKCKSILFRLQNNEIFCPNCNQEISKIIDQKLNLNEKEKVKTNLEINFNQNSESTYHDLYYLFSKKINELSSLMESTSDLYVLEKILINIDKILSIMPKLREFQKQKNRNIIN